MLTPTAKGQNLQGDNSNDYVIKKGNCKETVIFVIKYNQNKAIFHTDSVLLEVVY